MELLKIFDVISRMSALSRFSQTHLIKSESVLEHTGFVGIFSYIISIHLIEDGHDVDIGLVLRYALSHDIDEIITGDLPRPTKYANKELYGLISKMSEDNMKIVSGDLGSNIFFSDWSDSKEGREGLIVSISDSIAIVWKAWIEYSHFGNSSILRNTVTSCDQITRLIGMSKLEFDSDELNELLQQAYTLASNMNGESNGY